MRKQVAIMSGGDWADASVRLLSVPARLDLYKCKDEFDEWRKNNSYIPFPEWLRRFKGASDSSVEEYWEE